MAATTIATRCKMHQIFSGLHQRKGLHDPTPDRATARRKEPEQQARKLITIVPPENGWWGVRVMDRTLLHQSEESAVIERETYVEWLATIIAASLRKERAAVKRMVRVELERMRSGAFSVTNANNDYYWRLGYKRACSNILAALATREKR